MSGSLFRVEEAASKLLTERNYRDLAELKAVRRPVAVVTLLVEAVLILLEEGQEWKQFVKLAASPARLMEQIASYDLTRVTPKMLAKLQTVTFSPQFSVDQMKKASCAAALLCEWVLAVEAYSVARGVEA